MFLLNSRRLIACFVPFGTALLYVTLQQYANPPLTGRARNFRQFHPALAAQGNDIPFTYFLTRTLGGLPIELYPFSLDGFCRLRPGNAKSGRSNRIETQRRNRRLYLFDLFFFRGNIRQRDLFYCDVNHGDFQKVLFQIL